MQLNKNSLAQDRSKIENNRAASIWIPPRLIQIPIPVRVPSLGPTPKCLAHDSMDAIVLEASKKHNITKGLCMQVTYLRP